MQRYANRSGNSGVRGYRIADGSITVEFADGAIYRYTTRSAGSAAIAEMQRRAIAGEGLSTYISQHVRERYVAKLR